MRALRVALVAALLVVASSVAAGAAAGGATSFQTATPAAEEPLPLGSRLSAFMQASAGQADGAVANGMWDAAYENASEEAAKRDLVRQRVEALDGSLADLRAERERLREAYQDGDLTRAEYRARLSAVVGRLAALGDGIEATSERAGEVGVNATRLDELRTQARELGGQEVAALARTLAGGAPPGGAGVFGPADGGPGERSPGPPSDAGPPGERGPGGSDASSATPTPTPEPTATPSGS